MLDYNFANQNAQNTGKSWLGVWSSYIALAASVNFKCAMEVCRIQIHTS